MWKIPHWIDKKQLEFCDACIDGSFRPVDLTVEAVMIPDHEKEVMK